MGLLRFKEVHQMLRLYSTEQALALRGTIPELTITRSLQFQSDGYDHEEHGHIIVIQEGDDISRVTEIGPEGLLDYTNIFS